MILGLQSLGKKRRDVIAIIVSFVGGFYVERGVGWNSTLERSYCGKRSQSDNPTWDPREIGYLFWGDGLLLMSANLPEIPRPVPVKKNE